MFRQVISTCEWQYYKINYIYERCKHTKTKSCHKIFHVDSFVVLFASFFLLWTLKIFKKFDQTKMFQILLHTLSNLLDSTNLIKLIWLCISNDLSIVDWFK